MRYALTIKGRVQNAGYRDIIEKNARVRRLRGYVFNDIDGTVKLVCDGAEEKIDEFIEVINLHEEDIFVEDILKSEVEDVSPIPATFARLQTDMLEDIGRKLDKGVAGLKSIKEDTILLKDIREDTILLKDIKSDTIALVEGQNKMIEVLEKIAKK